MNKKLYSDQIKENKKGKSFQEKLWSFAITAIVVISLSIVGSYEKENEVEASGNAIEEFEVPDSYTRALEKAEIYFSWEDVSSEKVSTQLQAEGFSQNAIDYAITTSRSSSGKKAKDVETVELPSRYGNALQKAENYVSWAGVSPAGLRKQLQAEGLPQDAIDYTIVSLDVDYNEQALKKAESLNSCFSLSEQVLMNRLLSKGFTEGQVRYAVENLK